jgi:hypothetical protein
MDISQALQEITMEESFLLQLTHVVKQVFFDFLSVFYFVLLLLFHVFAYLVKETS